MTRILPLAAPQAAGPSAPDIVTQEKTRADESLDVPWNVVVHNDPINLMDYVTKVFMRIFGYPRERAERHMIEVHKKGRSILWSGARERAEFFAQQLQSHLLLTTIEKAE